MTEKWEEAAQLAKLLNVPESDDPSFVMGELRKRGYSWFPGARKWKKEQPVGGFRPATMIELHDSHTRLSIPEFCDALAGDGQEAFYIPSQDIGALATLFAGDSGVESYPLTVHRSQYYDNEDTAVSILARIDGHNLLTFRVKDTAGNETEYTYCGSFTVAWVPDPGVE